MNNMIPKILHYFWDGPEELPSNPTQWMEFIPGWKLNWLNLLNVTHPQKEELIKLEAWATLADVSRVQALIKHGGIYLDIDFTLCKPLDDLLGKAWVCVEGFTTIANGAMASPPDHPFFIELNRRLQRYDLVELVKSGYCNVAGPVLVSTLWKEMYGQWNDNVCLIGEIGDVNILPKRYFYPYSWNEDVCPPHEDSYAVHEWKARWKKPEVTNPNVTPEADLKANFTRTYFERKWGNEHPSGPGSLHENTVKDARFIRDKIREYYVDTLIDAPCGLFTWMESHFVTMDVATYFGMDIVPEIIELNNLKDIKVVSKVEHFFCVKDIVNEPILPFTATSLILCRECTQHLSDESTLKLLQNILNSKADYLIITNYCERKENRSSPTWGESLDNYGYREQNLDLPPYNLSLRADKIEDCLTYTHWDTVNYTPRYLSLYRLKH